MVLHCGSRSLVQNVLSNCGNASCADSPSHPEHAETAETARLWDLMAPLPGMVLHSLLLDAYHIHATLQRAFLKLGVREMAQQLRALGSLEENLGSIPSIHMVARNLPHFQVQGTRCPLLTSEDTRQTHATQTEKHQHKILIYIK